MTGVALKGLLGRKTRAILTSLAIVLGVAMMSGTFVLTDTLQKAFDGVLTSSYDNTSVVIAGKKIVANSANKPTVPASLLSKVKALPSVAAASGGFLFADIKLVDRNGKAIGGRGGAARLGFGVDPAQPRFNPIMLTSGSWASGPHEVVIDAGTASRHRYRVGDTIGANAEGPLRRYTVTGIGKLGDVSLGGTTMAVFDVPTAQTILNQRGRLDAISVAAKPGISDTRLAAEIRPLLPPAVQVTTAEEQAKADSKEVTKGIGIFRTFLLAFAGVALFVGAFVIFNTISITVAQRVREFATLRTLGASRRQVLRSVLLESLALGAFASLIGLLAGLGLAKGLNALFGAFGLDLPQGGTVLATRTVIVCLLAGTIVTLLAGVFPAIRATRVPPISAVREGATLPKSRFARYRPFVGVAVNGLGLALIAVGLFASSGAKGILLPIAAGTLLLFVGVAIVSNHLIRPLAAIVGQPARRAGGSAGRLAAENAVRNPGRTAATAAALMIGLALVTFVATLGGGLGSAVEDSLERQIAADYVVSGTGAGGSEWGVFPSAAEDGVAYAAGIDFASSVRSDQARVFGGSAYVVGVEPETIGRLYRFAWKEGSDSVLRTLGNGAIVDVDFAKKHHLGIGSRLPVETSTGRRRTFLVEAIYDRPQLEPLLESIVIAKTTFDRTFPHPKNSFMLVDVRGEASDFATASLRRSLAGFPDATVHTTPAWIEKDVATGNKVLGVLYVLLALSVLVSLFGIVNTLVLSVFERTRELGMLRAVGMTRMQVRRMIRHESIITALIGAALGLPLGLCLAGLVTHALSSEGVGFHLPLIQLVVFTLVAVVAGTLAAILPARRASRLNVLEALQYE